MFVRSSQTPYALMRAPQQLVRITQTILVLVRLDSKSIPWNTFDVSTYNPDELRQLCDSTGVFLQAFACTCFAFYANVPLTQHAMHLTQHAQHHMQVNNPM